MNAHELADGLRKRKQMLESTNDWIKPTLRLNYNKGIKVKLVYGRINLNSASRANLGVKPGDFIKVEFSPSQKVLRFTKSLDKDDYKLRADYQINAHAIYREFGINVLPARDMPDGHSYPPLEGIAIGDSLIFDVADFIETEKP